MDGYDCRCWVVVCTMPRTWYCVQYFEVYYKRCNRVCLNLLNFYCDISRQVWQWMPYKFVDNYQTLPDTRTALWLCIKIYFVELYQCLSYIFVIYCDINIYHILLTYIIHGISFLFISLIAQLFILFISVCCVHFYDYKMFVFQILIAANWHTCREASFGYRILLHFQYIDLKYPKLYCVIFVYNWIACLLREAHHPPHVACCRVKQGRTLLNGQLAYHVHGVSVPCELHLHLAASLFSHRQLLLNFFVPFHLFFIFNGAILYI